MEDCLLRFRSPGEDAPGDDESDGEIEVTAPLSEPSAAVTGNVESEPVQPESEAEHEPETQQPESEVEQTQGESGEAGVVEGAVDAQ